MAAEFEDQQEHLSIPPIKKSGEGGPDIDPPRSAESIQADVSDMDELLEEVADVKALAVRSAPDPVTIEDLTPPMQRTGADGAQHPAMPPADIAALASQVAKHGVDEGIRALREEIADASNKIDPIMEFVKRLGWDDYVIARPENPPTPILTPEERIFARDVEMAAATGRLGMIDPEVLARYAELMADQFGPVTRYGVDFEKQIEDADEEGLPVTDAQRRALAAMRGDPLDDDTDEDNDEDDLLANQPEVIREIEHRKDPPEPNESTPDPPPPHWTGPVRILGTVQADFSSDSTWPANVTNKFLRVPHNGDPMTFVEEAGADIDVAFYFHVASAPGVLSPATAGEIRIDFIPAL